MRKTNTLELEDRGVNKKFVIKEMGSMTAQDWIADGIKLLAATGIGDMEGKNVTNFEQAVQVLKDTFFSGAVSKLANFDRKAFSDLRLRLMACVSFKEGNYSIALDSYEKIEQYVEDQKTLISLQFEAFKTNFGFLALDDQPIFQALQSPEQKVENTSAPVISRRSQRH